MKSRVQSLMGLALAALLVVAAACGGSSSSSTPLTIGVIIERTGPLAALGAPELEAIRLAVREVNADDGIDGRQVKLVVRDSESQPAVASAAARELAGRDDIAAVIGTATGASCQAVHAILQAAGIMQYCLSPIASKTEPLIFWAQGPLSDYPKNTVPWFKDKGISRIAVLATADTTGDATKAIAENMAAYDPSVQIVGTETFNSGATDVTTQLTKLRALHPDLVFAGASGSNLLPIVRGLNSLDMQMPAFVTQGSVLHSVLGLVKTSLPPGGMVSGLFWVNVPTSEIPASLPYKAKITAFTRRWDATSDVPAGHSEAGAYDATTQILGALKAGATTGADIARHIERSHFTGVLGPYRYSVDNHQGAHAAQAIVSFGADGLFHVLWQGNA